MLLRGDPVRVRSPRIVLLVKRDHPFADGCHLREIGLFEAERFDVA